MKTFYSLGTILTPAEPLGPIYHEWVEESLTDDLIDDQVSLFKEAGSRPHLLFLGRKGAGKSALLAEIKMSAMRDGRGVLVSDELPRRGGHFVLPVLGWRHFHRIVKNVSNLHSEDDLMSELVPPEHFIELWNESLWDEIITYFYDYSNHPESRDLLRPVENYVNVQVQNDLPPKIAAQRLFASAKQAVITFLEIRNSRLFFLFDSMENYPVRNAIFAGVLSGLFQGLARISQEAPRIVISFCLPEEVENFVVAGSSNLMKDFASSFRIRWKPIELVRIVAHRLRLSAKIYDEPLYVRIRDLDFSSRADIRHLFSLVLPPKITNFQNTDENPWAYIIRHTQLLPRHVLAIFNVALSEQLRNTGSLGPMSESILRKGVSDVQRIIADHILMPYRKLYPKLLTEARRILPDLDPICDYPALRKVESRFDRKIEDDIGSVWDTFFEMGVIGRSTGASSAEHHSKGADGRYCYGHFHFNAQEAFGFATDGEYCFHPVFSHMFGMTSRSSDQRVVYPANIDVENIYVE